MIILPTPADRVLPRFRPLRIGYVALTDAAPFVVAQELGLYKKFGLNVSLSREVGWATIREKIIYGEIDAAHALAPMLWATHLGIDSAPNPVLTGLVLSQHGNAITLSHRLWDAGVRDATSLFHEARRRVGERRLTLGVVFRQSSHHIFLRSWLRSGGLDPDRDVRIVVVPPAQMFRNLAAGTIEGYCAGEPWNTLAIQAKLGWSPAWGVAQSESPVEKVLLVTERFSRERANEHLALIAALVEACAWCDHRENRAELAEILSRPEYLNQPISVLQPSLLGRFDSGHGQVQAAPDFHTFHHGRINAPTLGKAQTLQRELVEENLIGATQVYPALPGRLFREDIFISAMQLTPKSELAAS